MNIKAVKLLKAAKTKAKSRVRKIILNLSTKQKTKLLDRVMFYSELLAGEQILFEKVEGKVGLLSPNSYLPYETIVRGEFPWSKIQIANFPSKLLRREFLALVPSEEAYKTLCVVETDLHCYCREPTRGEKLVGKALNRM